MRAVWGAYVYWMRRFHGQATTFVTASNCDGLVLSLLFLLGDFPFIERLTK